ncbi:MAG TPA: ATP-binding protein [Symbiobacteriaceae bacterium]
MKPRRWWPGRWPLAVQLSVSFALVTALALVGGGLMLLSQMEKRQVAERSAALLARANAAANLVVEARQTGAPEDLFLLLYRFQQQTGTRAVVTDPEGVVLADAWGRASPLLGQQLTQPEVRAALQGREETGTRLLPGNVWVLYCAVPVREQGQVTGAVLLAADLSALAESLAELRRQLGLAAVVVGGLAVALGAGLAAYLTRPLVRLDRAAGALARGRLETRVVPGGSREVAALGRRFNAMAEELGRLDEQRRAFVANASHELRTPVTAVRALAEGLLEAMQGPEASRYREYLEDIVQECVRAGRLIEELLELARLDMRREARAEASQQEPVDLAAAVADLVHGMQPLAAERGVRLILAVSGPVQVRTDLRLVERVVGNLVENALKYTPAGGEARVTVTAGEQEVRITVADTGPGIAPEHLPRIFERFYRVDKARSRATGGAGLGLSIAAEAARLLGGRIEVESEVGKGSRFTLVLPSDQKAS